MYSSAENAGTQVATGSILARALRSLILLYMYVQRSIYIRILTFVPGIFLVPADLLLAAVAVHMLYICCTAATRPVVVQPDRGSPAPGPVDLMIEREVLFPAADRDPVLVVLCHGGVVEADRRALLQEAGVECPPADVAVEEPPGLVVGEAEGALELPDGEDLDPHALDRLRSKGHRETLRDGPAPDVALVEGVEDERERVAGLEDR